MALKVLNSDYSSSGEKQSKENKLLNDFHSKAISEVNRKSSCHSASQNDKALAGSNFESFRNNPTVKSKELLDRPSNEQSIPHDDKAGSEVDNDLEDPDEYVDDGFEEQKLHTDQTL